MDAIQGSTMKALCGMVSLTTSLRGFDPPVRAVRIGRLAAAFPSSPSGSPCRRRPVDNPPRLRLKRSNREISAMLWIAGTGFAGIIAGSMLLYVLI